ncbi:site-specific DNA-methyltransferase [Persephonella sp.]
MNTKNDLKELLKSKLKEIFRFEDSDLDFGIYKILNYKRKEIEKFIEEELIEKIKQELEILDQTQKEKYKEKLNYLLKDETIEKYQEAKKNKDEEKIKFYKEEFGDKITEYELLSEKLDTYSVSEDLEKQIYNHLINFFSRCYDKGDFISKRRYGKKEKYCIPYNGEEVYLYWANKDQYYIKTTEYFHKYTFKAKNLTVNFRVVEAEEEKGNIKSPEKKFFVLNKKIFDFDEEKRKLNIYFEYRGLTEDEEKKYKHGNSAKQEKINEEIVKILDERIPKNNLARLIFEKKEDKSLIEKHLYRYTRRNTTDYFIHKDLKRFLERELDFYIKNEFLQLEDLQVLEQSGYFDRVKLYLNKVKAFRNIALKIIDFLTQIENFQKKIWEKKKFVIDTHYVITLDKIKEYAGEKFLESILDEILNNEKQVKEWKELFGIEVKRKEDLIVNNEQLQFNGKKWKKLPIDTKYFNEKIKWKLLAALSEKKNLDDILDGVLIKSENFHALNLLLNKYYEKVQTIYIDPPYNTGNDDFLYKDNYQHSSWLTMMENRLRLAKELMKKDGVIFISIDDNELERLKILNENIFGEHKFLENFIWNNTSTPPSLSNISRKNVEYILTFLKSDITRKFKGRLAEGNDAPLLNRDNPIRVLEFPPSSVQFNIPDGIYSKGVKKRVELLDDIIVENGLNKNKFRLKFESKWTQETLNNEIQKGTLFLVKSKEFSIRYKRKSSETDWIVPDKYIDNVFLNKKAGVGTNEDASKEIINLELTFDSYPKPSSLIHYLIRFNTELNGIVLDFFAGSGTTAHAVMKLNKEDGGKREFILVEMADYFDTVIIPRIKKVAYSFNWKEGKPKDMDGIGVFFKYHTLEQYEDALENIEFGEPQKTLYELPDYFVKYMLEWETKKSRTFLNIDKMKDPFNYKLKVIENYQQKIVNVDLVETFNYLLGLNVSRYKVLEDNGRKYVFVFGEKDGKKIAIIWRNVKDIDLEKDKKIIEGNIEEFKLDEIYINGDAVVKNFKPIEPLFKSLMFEEIE